MAAGATVRLFRSKPIDKQSGCDSRALSFLKRDTINRMIRSFRCADTEGDTHSHWPSETLFEEFMPSDQPKISALPAVRGHVRDTIRNSSISASRRPVAASCPK
jgi:hypothetical protein